MASFDHWFDRICAEDTNPAGLWKMKAIAREAFEAGARMSSSADRDGCAMTAEPHPVADPVPFLVERYRRALAALDAACEKQRQVTDLMERADSDKGEALSEVTHARQALLKAAAEGGT